MDYRSFPCVIYRVIQISGTILKCLVLAISEPIWVPFYPSYLRQKSVQIAPSYGHVHSKPTFQSLSWADNDRCELTVINYTSFDSPERALYAGIKIVLLSSFLRIIPYMEFFSEFYRIIRFQECLRQWIPLINLIGTICKLFGQWRVLASFLPKQLLMFGRSLGSSALVYGKNKDKTPPLTQQFWYGLNEVDEWNSLP